MANEIYHSYDEAESLYALIWRKTDDKIYDAAAGSDTFDTYTDTDILDYDVPLTNHVDSDYHSVDFPAGISAGVYRVQIMHQVGGAIDADVDRAVAQGEIHWDGTAEMDISTLDTLLDDLITDQNKVTNIYDETGVPGTPTITSTGRLAVAGPDC